MVDEHRHEHENGPLRVPEPPARGEELDAAGKSLSDALRISFAILKVIMIVLVVAFLASGFKTVGPDEKALVLHFGKITGVGEEAILGPGAHWVFPYPIDELVRIPVAKNINLAIHTFWYKETRDDILGPGPKPRRFVPEKLDPLQEGYCLTGSQKTPARLTAAVAGPQGIGAGTGSDYNIVHTKWQINYQITGVEHFFRNVYVQDIKPGQVYFDVMAESITPLLKSVVENAVVDALAQYSIDEAILSADTIRRHVSQLVQQELDELETGIRVTQVQLVEVKWPKQVDEAFQAFFTASQESQQAISEARTYAENTLTQTGGRVAKPLYEALMAKAADEQLEALWSQTAGDAQNTIAQAQGYRTKVVEGARANANYLLSILPEYRKRPEIVAQTIYRDKMQEILSNADEKFILDKSEQAREQEFRILINRDALLKPKGNPPKPPAP
jgi:membrane protease subunit HflK